MKRGAWHQFGDRSPKLALEQLNSGSGVGVILSPRDLSFSGTVSYASKYRELGAEVLFDQQFYVPQFSNVKLDSYPTSKHRKAASQLGKLSDQELAALSVALEEVNRAVEANAVVAPALVYQAGRPEIVALNGRDSYLGNRCSWELPGGFGPND
jgi:hypothetical protein